MKNHVNNLQLSRSSLIDFVNFMFIGIIKEHDIQKLNISVNDIMIKSTVVKILNKT